MFNDYKKEVFNLANTEGGRYLLGKLGQKPQHRIVDIGKDYFTEHLEGNLYQSTFYPRVPVKHLFLPILTKTEIAEEYVKDKYDAFLHYSMLQPKNYKYPQIFLNETTFNPDADPESTSVDGHVYYSLSDQTFATIRGAATGTSASPSNADLSVAEIYSSNLADKWNTIVRGFFLFDTSSLTEAATISSATFSIYGTAISDVFDQSIGMITTTPASNTDLVVADYDQVGTTLQASAIDLGSYSASAYNDFTLNATGLGNISKTSISKFGTSLSCDYGNSEPTWAQNTYARAKCYLADQGSNEPKLTVTYTLPGGNPMFFSGGGLTVG